MATMTLRYPHGGYRVEVDSSEIYPDDPGMGTPAMVYGPDGSSATYGCACDTGELTHDSGAIHELPAGVLNFLQAGEVEEAIHGFIDQHS